jgi:ATP-dependent DNA helicase RecG
LNILANGALSRTDAQAALGLKGQANFRERYLGPALETDLIEMTVPDKPRSRNQRYRLTALGRKILGQQQKDRS